ncbi:MAG TPA: oligosaccharide flippase family protein [Hyphomicrobiaceae bacterium]|nr:oligosaccharide flippase family protein [Hyphomicrobiaceae bacterium]
MSEVAPDSRRGDADDGRKLWRFIGWYGASEMAQRVTRIVTTILLARWLTPEAFGVAAIAITTFEIVRIAANAGIGQAVVRARDEALVATLEGARRLLPKLMLGLAVVQCFIGLSVAWVTGRPELGLMIAVLAGVYLMMPAGLIEAYLLQRSERHRAIAGVATAQAVADNVLTAALALSGFGAWAIVLPKVLTTPIWVLGMRWSLTRPDTRGVVPVPARDLLAYSVPVAGTELAAAARLHLDKVLVGALLGVEALGIYYFVFNAGLGLSLSLTTALSNSVYPHLARVADDARALLERLDRAVVRTAIPIGLVIGLQAALAVYYVPLLFGQKWAHAAVLVQLLTVSAVAKPLADLASQALRASGRTSFDFAVSSIVSAVALAGLAVGLQGGLWAGIAAMSVMTILAQIVAALVVRRVLAAQAPGGSLAVKEVL